jgi:hypothetical protein
LTLSNSFKSGESKAEEEERKHLLDQLQRKRSGPLNLMSKHSEEHGKRSDLDCRSGLEKFTSSGIERREEAIVELRET